MRRRATTGAALLVGAAVAAGCGHSPPTRFFTLDPLPPSRPAAAAAIAPVQLDAVHIPAVLDRPELVREVAPNRLAVSDQDRWGAPLGDMMRRTLAQDLLARLPAGSFVLPDAPRTPGARGLVVNVLQLQARADGRIDLQASWTLLDGSPPRTVVRRDVELTEEAPGGGPDGEAAAVSRLLGALADRIAAALAP